MNLWVLRHFVLSGRGSAGRVHRTSGASPRRARSEWDGLCGLRAFRAFLVNLEWWSRSLARCGRAKPDQARAFCLAQSLTSIDCATSLGLPLA